LVAERLGEEDWGGHVDWGSVVKTGKSEPVMLAVWTELKLMLGEAVVLKFKSTGWLIWGLEED
jgi:hypothetical protein